ncbi:MAG: aminotransferase class V-fold PLP-dependent enzyme [Muribaculaceae bacterium]|nr:aminotransferase class V-fold PLP-dependent enzyme [Muribaculaceae bacterium]
MKSYVFPGNIEDSILRIGGEPFPYMRTAGFSSLVKDSERMLLSLINNPGGRVIFYTASGTGAMDAVTANYVSCFNKAFIIDGGSFGHRWQSLCDYYGIANDTMKVPFARDIDYAQLAARVQASGAGVLLCQHHETSTGQLFDLDKISAICRSNGVSLVVDAISSFLTDPLDMERSGIDVCITSSQKGLNIAPGLSLVFLAPRILDKQFNHSSYYFDFAENLKNLERGQTPYSPATTIFLQLHARLKADIAIGVDALVDTAHAKASYFRRLCRDNGWEMPVETPSNCITGFFVKQNSGILFQELLKEGIEIMPGGTPGYFRVSHSGIQTTADLDELADAIKRIENISMP